MHSRLELQLSTLSCIMFRVWHCGLTMLLKACTATEPCQQGHPVVDHLKMINCSDIQKSGELGKMFDIQLEEPPQAWQKLGYADPSPNSAPSSCAPTRPRSRPFTYSGFPELSLRCSNSVSASHQEIGQPHIYALFLEVVVAFEMQTCLSAG
ncbi:hypothetical protein L7F22_062306 [Adiantum nelumboides]|nr:hypothetical protein [Adiantum nelumboides]